MTTKGRNIAIPARTPSQGQWHERFVFFLLNVFITAILQFGCVVTVGAGLRGVPKWIIPAAVLSQAGFLNLYPLSIGALLTMSCDSRKRRIIGAICFGLGQSIIMTDLAAFRLFGLHFLKATTFEMLATPGVRDVFRPGTATIITLLFAYFFLIAASLWMSLRLVPWLLSCPNYSRKLKYAFVLILGCTLVERSALGWRSLGDSTPLDSMEDTLTFYVPLDVAPWVKGFGWASSEMPIALWDPPGTLHLPKNPLGPPVSPRQPNILFITIESARADALTSSIMPNTSRLAGEGWRLDKHFSTGSCTPLGCFGIFYSLSVNYMAPVGVQKKDSPAIEYLRRQNYDFSLLSAAGLDYSGLPQTAFRGLTNSITDKWDCARLDRDRQMAEKFVNFLDARQSNPSRRPFFGFLFFDASHLPYDYPPEDAILDFKLKPGEVNYALLWARPKTSSDFKNCYLNSLHYVDRQIGSVLQRLRDIGEYENTVVIITGDHGEEFGECGHFAHLNGLNRFQTQTLAAIRLPGEASRLVTNLTSHVDFFPTLFQWMGVTNSPADYSIGVPIQSGIPRGFVVVGGPGSSVIVKEKSFTTFRESTRRFRPRPVLYQNHEEQDLGPGVERATSEDIVELTEQYHRFY
jgi:membrane-anchored protein YejM (alkaline phosphatase superfamily)